MLEYHPQSGKQREKEKNGGKLISKMASFKFSLLMLFYRGNITRYSQRSNKSRVGLELRYLLDQSYVELSVKVRDSSGCRKNLWEKSKLIVQSP